MAIYHLSVKTVSRSTGRSSVGAAAYRCGQRLTNERDGVAHDYRARIGVEHSEVILPENAPAWMQDRAALWNAAEKAEARKDAKTAREYELALPHELDAQQRQDLAHEFGRHVAEKFGVAVDVSIHTPHARTSDGPEIDAPGGDLRNFHAHVLTTTRRVTPDGLGEKTRELDVKQTSADLVDELRAEWASMTNSALERAGVEVRVDHRSYKRQGRDVTPTLHLGKESVAMLRDGVMNNRIEAYQQAKEDQVIDFAAERAKYQEKQNGRRVGSSDHRVPTAQSREELPWWRDGVQRLSDLPLAHQLPRKAGVLLHGDAPHHMGGKRSGNRAAVQRQSHHVSAADLAWLKAHILELKGAQRQAAVDRAKIWKGPDQIERPIAMRQGHLNVPCSMTEEDVRPLIQKGWPAAMGELERAQQERKDVLEEIRNAGILRQVFDWRLTRQAQKAKVRLEQAQERCSKLDRAWAAPKAQKWTTDIISKAERLRAEAIERVRKADVRYEGVTKALDRQERLLKELEAGMTRLDISPEPDTSAKSEESASQKLARLDAVKSALEERIRERESEIPPSEAEIPRQRPGVKFR